MAKNKFKDRTAVDIAMELLEVRRNKNELTRIDRVLSEELKKRIRAGESQENYRIRTDYALQVKDTEKALPWALEHNCVDIDVTAVDHWVKNNRHSIPDGFALVEKEKLVEVTE